ncbi:hypothetical protein AO715_14510 [Xanthomonas sp. Mitacek01]|nr:hypothetical protein AO715_14510 [Xanthomonas sp. Mitacek01]
MSQKREGGFTLVELMVTVAIIAVLLAIGLPSFRDTLQRNRVAATTNEIIGSLALARNEAIRTTRGGGICASADGQSCSASGDWNEGWVVWANQGAANATLDTGDELVRVIAAHPQMSLAVVNEAGTAAGTIAFDARGRSRTLTGFTLSLRPTVCKSGARLARSISVNLVGQVKTAEGSCP